MATSNTFSHGPHTNPPAIEAVGESDVFLAFQQQLSRAAGVDRPILILGERGTGKELAARRLHYLSPRWQSPLVMLNCAALAPSLIETELFGHEKGAFTGALSARAGRFETSDGGTLFLDEIGAVPMEVQEKILRVVEYGTFERVGGSKPVAVDVRTIGATNADVVSLSESGRFKKDLLDRLSFEVLVLPPLRERKGDIELLANHFARRMALELDRNEIPYFSKAAAKTLESHEWPGNIRELKNAVERAVYRSDTAQIKTIELNPFQSPFFTSSSVEREHPAGKPSQKTTGTPSLEEALDAFEVRMIQEALASARFNQKKAAAALGLTYDQLRGRLRKHGHKIAT